MTKGKMNINADEYFSKTKKWQKEMSMLRSILLDSQLTEDLKWGKPCYMFQGNNIAIIIGFKDYCAVSFFKGSLLQDVNGALIMPGENSQASRQLRFTSIEDILKMEAVLKIFIHEAIEVEKAGLKVNFKKNTDLIFPDEFQNRIDENPDLKDAFNSLTQGRQRAYILYFSAPIQSKTRQSRVEKCIQSILDGKGLND